MNGATLAALWILTTITPESARFNIFQDGKRIGSEQFTITARSGGYRVEARTQLNDDPTPITSVMELDEQLNPTSYEYKRGAGVIRVKFAQPVSEYETVADGRPASIDFRFPADGFILDNNFFHHYLLLLHKVGGADKTLPVFVPQDMRMGSAAIRPKGNGVYELQVGDVQAEAVTDERGRLMRLSVPAAKVVVER